MICRQPVFAVLNNNRMAQYLEAAPCLANRGSRLFKVDFVDCLASQTFPGSSVKFERRNTHLQRFLNLGFVLCHHNYAAIKAAGPYACFAIDISSVIWQGKKDYFLNRFT